MKKYVKIIIPVLILVVAAVYAFVPGAKTLSHQTVRATKAVAAHYDLIQYGRCGKYTSGHHDGQHDVTHHYVAVGPI